ncbi:gamma-glutamyltransferase [candidate division KSB1 bacterium]|nr:gamma-glutamyltransferase [candidate division KSB1 bacterium]NIR70554.1 gamma-glutamyltransferase [candidate division KSB1 bacterium]NIS27700.1 gamma-glutamyltransferase [candidate division KSB1 bacterium]NIT74531.1 gamma-glutamyltransferase [candidate division KSB1 bacterium]NIU28353.1 gamma-glutamyltransferase [candidate division KSB1 bacterium]
MKLENIENRFEATSDGKCAFAEGGMVATAFPEATQAGVEMLRKGGNAIDAACAAALVLGVCEPQASGVGGQSMAILHTQGKTIAIDGSTRVPSLAHISHFMNGDRLLGYRATTVPSTVTVLGYLNFHYGELEWPEILQPAIRIAKEGYLITRLQHDLQMRELEKFFEIPSRSGARYFLKKGNRPYEVGERFVQSDLANLLQHLAEHGPHSFYRGKIARQIDEDMRANDGFLRKDDLALIPRPIERIPLKRRYRDIIVHTMPPPAAGRTLLLVLLMLNHLPSRFLRSGSPESYHFIAETFRKAFLQRRERPYDPNTYPQIPEKKMINRAFAEELAKTIRDTIDAELPWLEPPMGAGDTTHLSVMDAQGNAIGITQSIELAYGSKAAANGLGFLYNNYMNALENKKPGHPFYLRPNAIPWTSVAPAIVFHKDTPWMVVGSPGSSRIYSAVSQFLVHVIDGRQPICEAMRRPRFHCSIGGTISLEADRFDPEIIHYLADMGYKIDRRRPYSFYLGAIQAALRCKTRDGFQGVAEIRRDGMAAGLS